MGLPRPRSLFWTLSGAFLAVLVLATLLQGIVVVAVVRPMAERAREDRLRVSAAEVARRLEASGEEAPEAIAAALRSGSHDSGFGMLLFLTTEGTLVSRWPIPPEWVPILEARLGNLEVRDVFPERRPGRRPSRRPPGVGEDTPPSGPGMDPPPPEVLPPADRPPGGFAPPAASDGPRRLADRWRQGRNLEVLVRIPVDGALGPRGELIAVSMGHDTRLLSPDAPWRVVGFLPVAMLLAAAAGMLLFRRLVKRLRRIEELAERVTEGDLDARVEDPGQDEIGRLGRRLNHMTARLAEARETLEASDRNRRQLIADISHELGTPLTSIRGYTETLLDPQVPVNSGEREEYLRNVLEESRRLDLLVQDLFELTRLEGGAIALQRECLDWATLCRNTVERFRPRFREAGLTVAWTGASAEAWVEADGHRLEQVLNNLLVNALRYVPSGGRVEVGVFPEPNRTASAASRAGVSHHQLRVQDDGPGIPAEDLPQIFERFYRVDPARPTGGTGLGLAIAREIVQRHGGAIRAEAADPTGVAFVVDLPAVSP